MNNSSTQSAQKLYKIAHPSRHQMEFKEECLDNFLPPNHKARKIWDFVQSLDTNPCFVKIRSMQGRVGRPTTSPHVLLCLWLYALTEGISSGRKIAELTMLHDAYRWICGGLSINRTMVCEFRASDSALFHQLLTSSLAIMLRADLLTSEDLAQDGTRLQAAAGFNTYRGENSLSDLLAKADGYIKEVESLTSKELEEVGTRKVSARRRAAREQKERLEEAQRELTQHQEDIKDNKASRSKKEVQKKLENCRASHVDPTVRKMKMGDGSFRLAYNVQFATGTDSRTIVGVQVTNTLDPGTLATTMMQVHTRLKKLGLPFSKHWVADSAYSSAADITEAGALFPNCKVIAPTTLKNIKLAKKPKKDDSKELLMWKKILGTDEFKDIYKKRCSTAEFSNMTTKERGFERLRVRGIGKVLSQSLLYALMHNMMRFWDLSSGAGNLI